ncbi:hypothetical protein ABI_39900 [Asticcacaulis biprosthecium C19]|uniref:Uncharacterized protein n=1 Tax=Asticcacaulis biprosthecium C19 TaxID=715226 RepID=F4QS53_9CAUL|nr:hypothetical protein [Asticcacaulis biprosthecium]EGF89573.1 hypothetical protein ABI_39900 [Asticcacaulis biprosthecium C19]
MLICCYETWFDLAHVVTVSDVRQPRMSANGPYFRVGITGIDSELYFEAPTPSAADRNQLITEREGVLANWRRFKGHRADRPESIHRLGDLHINLSAISALTGIADYQVGLGGNGAAGARAPGYEIYILGLRTAIRRLVSSDGLPSLALLEDERFTLLESWARLHAAPTRAA